MVENIHGTTVLKFFRNFIEITLQHGCSPVNLLHIFRTPFVKNKSGWLLLKSVDLVTLKVFFQMWTLSFFQMWTLSMWTLSLQHMKIFIMVWLLCWCLLLFLLYIFKCMLKQTLTLLHSDAYDLVLFSLVLFRSWHVYLGISRNFFKHRKHGALSFLRYIFTRPEISA